MSPTPQLVPTIISKLLDAIDGTGASITFALPARTCLLSWTTSFDIAPAVIDIDIDVSLDGVTWVTIDTSTATIGETRLVATTLVAKFVRAVVNTNTGNRQVTIQVLTNVDFAKIQRTIFGELVMVNNVTALTLTVQNTWYLIDTNWAINFANGMTLIAADGSITSDVIAQLYINATLSIVVGAGSHAIEIAIFKNGVQLSGHLGNRTIAAASVTMMPISGIDLAAAADVYDIRIRCTDAAGQTVTIENANFSAFSVNGNVSINAPVPSTSGDITVTDGSGAGLALTDNITPSFYMLGELLHISLDVTYPATADGSDASLVLGNVPSTIMVGSGGVIITDAGAGFAFTGYLDGSEIKFFKFDGTAVKNSELSTTELTINIIARVI